MNDGLTDGAAADQAGRRVTKSASAFRTISEVASELDVPSHVLRFWETKFNQVKPMKRGGGRRYYRPEDVTLLRRIRALLYDDGYTIKGVQKLLREGGLNDADPAAEPPPAPRPAPATAPAPASAPTASGALDPKARKALEDVLAELESIKSALGGKL
jgi:DNA-binding transcriptional MerR regulator